MTGGADRVAAVHFHGLAHRQRLTFVILFLEGRDLGRRGRRGRTEQVLHDPLAAVDRRRAGCQRRHRQHAAVAEDAGARLLAGVQRHPPEPVAAHAGDAVVARQALVHIRVVRREQVEHAAVFLQDAPHEQLGLPLEGPPQVLVELGKEILVRHRECEVPRAEPLRGEIVDQRVRAGIGQHPADLAVEYGRVAQPARRCRVQQLLVGNAAPQEERQPRGELQIGDPVGRLGSDTGRVLLDAEKEIRADQNPLQRQLDAGLESTAVPPRLVEPDQRLHIRLGDGAAEGAPGDSGDDPPCTMQLPFRRLAGGRAAGEDAPPAGRIAGAGHAVRAADLDAADTREAELGVVVVPRLRLHGLFGRPLDNGRLIRKGDADHMPPRGHRRAEFHLVVRVRQVVCQRRVVGLQPFVTLLDLLAAHVERLDSLAVQQRIDAVGVQQPADLVYAVARHPYPEDVLPVHGEVVRYGDAAARAERQVLVRAAVLHERPRDAVGDGPQLGVPYGQPADLARRRHVALKKQRRDGQDVGDIVESPARVIRREQRRHIDVEIEEVAHRAAIFRAVQAMDRRAARVRIVERNLVQGGLEPRHDRLGLGVRRSRPVGRRHAAGAELPEHLLPHGRILADVTDIPALQAQPGGLQPVVVAGQAVAVEHGPVGRGGSPLLRRRRGRPERRACRQQDREENEGSAKPGVLHV